jgi:hypothetical protein
LQVGDEKEVAKLGMEDSPVLGNRLLKTLRTKIHWLYALFSNIYLYIYCERGFQQ